MRTKARLVLLAIEAILLLSFIATLKAAGMEAFSWQTITLLLLFLAFGIAGAIEGIVWQMIYGD